MHRALNPDEAINQELLQAVLARFLSFTSKDKKIRWTDKALAQFKYRVKELTGRSWGGYILLATRSGVTWCSLCMKL